MRRERRPRHSLDRPTITPTTVSQAPLSHLSKTRELTVISPASPRSAFSPPPPPATPHVSFARLAWPRLATQRSPISHTAQHHGPIQVQGRAPFRSVSQASSQRDRDALTPPVASPPLASHREATGRGPEDQGKVLGQVSPTVWSIEQGRGDGTRSLARPSAGSMRWRRARRTQPLLV